VNDGSPTRPIDNSLGGFFLHDGNETIELYHVEGLNHSDSMAIVYLPKEKIVIIRQVPSCGRRAVEVRVVNANSVTLFRNLKRLKLDVAQHVPIHGNPRTEC
jgi:hypothetical protein